MKTKKHLVEVTNDTKIVPRGYLTILPKNGIENLEYRPIIRLIDKRY